MHQSRTCSTQNPANTLNSIVLFSIFTGSLHPHLYAYSGPTSLLEIIPAIRRGKNYAQWKFERKCSSFSQPFDSTRLGLVMLSVLPLIWQVFVVLVLNVYMFDWQIKTVTMNVLFPCLSTRFVRFCCW